MKIADTMMILIINFYFNFINFYYFVIKLIAAQISQ